jgi:hypothetical protein
LTNSRRKIFCESSAIWAGTGLFVHLVVSSGGTSYNPLDPKFENDSLIVRTPMSDSTPNPAPEPPDEPRESWMFTAFMVSGLVYAAYCLMQYDMF